MLPLLSALVLLLPTAALAHPQPTGDPDHDDDPAHITGWEDRDPNAALEAQDEQSADIVSDGPTGRKIKNMVVTGRGERLIENATTDVWALGDYAYIGTFNEPCGTGENFQSGVAGVELVDGVEEPGIAIFDVENKNKPQYVGNLPSVEGSRTNDVKVAETNSGTILVHSNESCAGGPGGFEIYNVDDPLNPAHLASIRIDDPNPAVLEHPVLGPFVTDAGVHNLFLFTQGDRDYVAVVAETWLGNFQIYEITDPTAPDLVSVWGAENLCDPDAATCPDDPLTETDPDVLFDLVVNWLLGGFGASANRLLHDITISADGTSAYLSNWDAGLVLLDISDPADPEFVSTALEPVAGSLDGEVNSHAAWPSEDGSIVVETEEDFSVFASEEAFAGTFGNSPANTIPGVGVSTRTGDAFEANPGNVVTVDADSVTVESGPLAGNVYDALEFSGSQPRFADTGPITGEAVWIGLACDEATTENPESFPEGGVAIARRGDCLFATKLATAADLGASAIVIANNVQDTVWGGVRIWDYSDPADPKLASTFNTVCSANPTDPSCDRAGTYSVHNVIVESRGNKTFAYISWYWDGMVVLDATDPYNPVEIARFFDNSPAFIEANGGNPHDFWGVYKIVNEPFVYGSDRNGGLYVFKLTGRGSGN
ncbi:MAG TPA: PA domain-containing protein [Actinomycetota bacterium]